MIDVARAAALVLGLTLLLGARSAPAIDSAEWEGLAPLPEARQEVGVAELDGRIFVLGGIDDAGRTVRTAEVYDPETDAWATIASLPEALHHVSVGAAAGQIFAVGGLTSGFAGVARLFVYDPVEDEWKERSAPPTARGAGAVAVLDGRIYFAGGFRNNTSVADFAVYDPLTDEWTSLAPMPTARDHLGAAAIDGSIYAVGGRAGSLFSVFDVLEAYDPQTGAWSTRAPMPTARAGIAAALLRGRLFVFGGEGNAMDPQGVFHETEAYDAAADRWESCPDMQTARHGMAAAALGDRVFVPGGATVAGFGASAVNEALRLPPCLLDVDASGGRPNVATDVVYVARRHLDLDPVPASFRALDPSIPPDVAIGERADTALLEMDVDGSGAVEVATDLVYVARGLLGLPPVPASFRDSDPGIPSDETIAAAIDALCP